MAVFRNEADKRIVFEPAGELGQTFVVEVQEFDAQAPETRRILRPPQKTPTHQMRDSRRNAALLHGTAETKLRGIARFAGGSLRIECRATEISQVLLNLLNSAVDAVQPLPEKWVELQVKNAGKEWKYR